ncbi:hypothetical protein HWQ67_18845, partial [Candidatus Magnetobacterium casensis]
MTEKTLDELATEIHQTAVEKGWWKKSRSDLEVICLMHTELSEAVEELRMGNPVYWLDEPPNQNEKPIPSGWLVELADCLIRMLDFIAAKGAQDSFYECLRAKMEYNKT